MSNRLYCSVCGASLRSGGGGFRCSNGCCAACHQRHCSGAGHQLDAKKARDAEGIRLLAALRSDIALRDDLDLRDEPFHPAAAD